jgi:hypothetical protein
MYSVSLDHFKKGVTVAWLVCTLEDHIVSKVSPLRGTTMDSDKKGETLLTI